MLLTMNPFLLSIALLSLITPNLFAKELPGMLKMRIEQMNMLQRGKTELSDEYPKEASGLFQGIRKSVNNTILTKRDHLNAIAAIPKHLMKDHIISETIEFDGWFYTSIEHKDWVNKKASWFGVVASAKNSKVLCFSYSW